MQEEENGPVQNPGLKLTFHAQAAFANPMFKVHCDHPCLGSEILFRQAGQGGATYGGGGSYTRTTSDPNVVIFESGNRQSLGSDDTVYITVRSRDDGPVNSATVEGYVQ